MEYSVGFFIFAIIKNYKMINEDSILPNESKELSSNWLWDMIINVNNSVRPFQANISESFEGQTIKGEVFKGFTLGLWRFEDGGVKKETIFIR